jgi:hypothetical protein
MDMTSDGPVPIPVVGRAMEGKLRKLAFRLGRPGFVERMQHRLDRDGVFDPDAPPHDPALLRLHEKLSRGRWWEEEVKN